MRIQGIVLKYETDAAVFGRNIGDIGFTEIDAALGRNFKTADQVECGGFAAAGRAEQSDELAVRDFKGQIACRNHVLFDLFIAVRKPLGQVFQSYLHMRLPDGFEIITNYTFRRGKSQFSCTPYSIVV